MRTRISAVMLLTLASAGIAAAQSSSQIPRSSLTMKDVVDRAVAAERAWLTDLPRYTPITETYIQNIRRDSAQGPVPDGDSYFLGRANFANGISQTSLKDDEKKKKRSFWGGGKSDKADEPANDSAYRADRFLRMAVIDPVNFDSEHYRFEYVGRTFLGEIRCIVFDVVPQGKGDSDSFVGRIWIEDQGFHVVRFNGAFGRPGSGDHMAHFDSWRANISPGLWLPSFIYSEDRGAPDIKNISRDFKAQTRFWAYDLSVNQQGQDLSKISIDTPVGGALNSLEPVTGAEAERAWDRQAEDNVTSHLEHIGLLSRKGEVDKVLETVVNNLEVTNNLDIEPEIRCRVLMTTTLESFAVGHTIVLSRGLIDVIPDEATLASVISHEMAHIVLGHRGNTNYAFFDELLSNTQSTLRQFDFKHTPEEEQAASAKALEIIKKSPYKDHLASAGAFIAALNVRHADLPNLISSTLLGGLPAVSTVAQPASAKEPAVAALPIGGRVKFDLWDNSLQLLKSQPVGLMSAREKTPFEITAFMPNLTRVGDANPGSSQGVDAERRGSSAKNGQSAQTNP